MKIVFRTKAGKNIGFGHLRRCLTLAKALHALQATIFFIVNDDLHAFNVIQQEGFQVFSATEKDEQDLKETSEYIKKLNADVIVVDSYDISHTAFDDLQNIIRIVIEDRNILPKNSDLIINSSATIPTLPVTSMPSQIRLLGKEYALLDAIYSYHVDRQINESIKEILITVGGSDSSGLTLRLLNIVRTIFKTEHINVVIGPFFPETVKERILSLVSVDKNMRAHENMLLLHPLMLTADLAITGAGQTIFELAATGTPMLAIKVADNQHDNLVYFAAEEVLEWVGNIDSDDLEATLKSSLLKLNQKKVIREKMSKKGRQLIDGLGAKRVAEKIYTLGMRDARNG